MTLREKICETGVTTFMEYTCLPIGGGAGDDVFITMGVVKLVEKNSIIVIEKASDTISTKGSDTISEKPNEVVKEKPSILLKQGTI